MTPAAFLTASDEFDALAERHFSDGNIRAGGELLFGALTATRILIAGLRPLATLPGPAQSILLQPDSFQ